MLDAAPRPTASFYDRMQAGRPTAPPPPEKEVVQTIRPRLVSVSCGSAPEVGEWGGFRAIISQEIILALPQLRPGHSFVNLVVPKRPGGEWYLDTAPRPADGYQLPAGRTLFRIRPVPRKFFAACPPDATPTLRFLLGQEIAPGYFRLVQLTNTDAATRRAGHLPADTQTPAEQRRARRARAQREARALLRQQAAAGVPRAVEQLKREAQAQAARQRVRRQRADTVKRGG